MVTDYYEVVLFLILSVDAIHAEHGSDLYKWEMRCHYRHIYLVYKLARTNKPNNAHACEFANSIFSGYAYAGNPAAGV
jgi:hypothetical protein